MKVLDFPQPELTLENAFEMAKKEVVAFRWKKGRRYAIVPIDDFDLEVELLRGNKTFMAFLDELSQEKATISLEEIERELGLA